MAVSYSEIKVDQKLLTEWREKKREYEERKDALQLYILGYYFFLGGFPSDAVACVKSASKYGFSKRTKELVELQDSLDFLNESSLTNRISVQHVFNTEIVRKLVKETNGSSEKFQKLGDKKIAKLEKEIGNELHKELMGQIDRRIVSYLCFFPAFVIDAILTIVENQKLLKYYS